MNEENPLTGIGSGRHEAWVCDPPSSRIDRARYRRVRGFLVSVLLHALWWDVILNRPVLRRLRTEALPRWQRIARRYRTLAVELGGVLIKLGQFLSTRVDILPLEIVRELSELQDQVPPEPLAAVTAIIEDDFQRPLEQVFSWISDEPVGAASLAQVHEACLPDGREVVVKVLRPGIDVLVATDLTAFAHATRWLRLSRTIRRRVDVEWIEREFTLVTRRELDMQTEAANAERFARDFADEPDVDVPEVIWSHTAARTLTMENVAGIKISDTEAINAAGIDAAAVASRLYAIYMRQFFETQFVHADPHPGNIFVTPQQATGDGTQGRATPFRIAFVDFGMVTEIPERMRHAMREFAIGLGTRDARRIVQSYVAAGSLLEDADIERIVEAHETVLARFWGVRMAKMRDLALSEAQELIAEYRDLLLAAPIQLQADMLFAMRAVGLLAGLCTSLDPDFEPWTETIPFARQFAREQRLKPWPEWVDEAGHLLQDALRLPSTLDRLLRQAERGTVGVQAELAPKTRQQMRSLRRSVDRLSWTVLSAALLVCGVLLEISDRPAMVPWLLGGACLSLLAGLLRSR